MSVIVNIIARLGADAELRENANGKFISMRGAVNEFNKQKGEEETIWFSIIAEANDFNLKMMQYWTKGKLLNFVGKERVSLYTTKDGNIGIDRTVRTHMIDFVPGSKSVETTNQTSTVVNNELPQGCGTFKPQPSIAQTVVANNSNDDDLPF